MEHVWEKAELVQAVEFAIAELAETVELAEEAALAELGAFGSYDAVPSCVEAFGVHEAIETQFAGVFGGRR